MLSRSTSGREGAQSRVDCTATTLSAGADLEQLLDVARQAHIALPAWSDDLLDLTPYAVETRYPGYWEEITTTERDRAIELAALTVEWAATQLGGKP